MNKLAITILAVLMVLLTAIMAQAQIIMPLPINGKVDGAPGGVLITVQNIRTGVIMETETTDSGEYLIDWANSESDGTVAKYLYGDQFRVSVDACKETSVCTVDLRYTGQPQLYTVLYPDIDFVPIEPCPVCGVCAVCETCLEPNVCEECESCDDENDWTKVGVSIVIGLISGMVIFFGGGIKIYKNIHGEATLQHRHKGIRGYHDINTKHSDERYSHRRYREDPLGCMNDVKKIEEQGALI